MCYQPMDVGSFFKVIKFASQHSTTSDKILPLGTLLEDNFQQLISREALSLNPRKLGPIIDCAATAPQVKSKAFWKHLIEKPFVDCGFTSGVDGCPNIHAVMQASNVTFSQCYIFF